MDAAEAFLQRTGGLLAKKSASKQLRSGRIDIARVANANRAAVSDSVVQAISFHPSAPAMLTAGLDKTMRVFQVDGKHNTLLQSTHLKDLPIWSAAFSSDGSEVRSSDKRLALAIACPAHL